MQVWNVLHTARWKYSTQQIAEKSPFWHYPTTLSGYIFATKAHIDNRKKNLLSSNISSTCPHNMVNFGPVAAEICWRVCGTPANFNGFRVLAALLHRILVLGISQTLRHWTEGATYIWQGGHHVGHWPTFLVEYFFVSVSEMTYWDVKHYLLALSVGSVSVTVVVTIAKCITYARKLLSLPNQKIN